MGPMEYTEWKLGDHTVGGMMAHAGRGVPADMPAYWLAYFGAADCDVTVARGHRVGGDTVGGPMDIPAGRFAVMADPSGVLSSG